MATPSSDRIIGVNEFFAASEARVDRWRTLNRVAKALAAGGARPAGGHGPDPKALLAELQPLEDLCGYPGPASDGAGPGASEGRRLDWLRAPGAADQRRASRQQLPGRPGALEDRRGRRCPPARRPAPVDRSGPGPPPVLRDPDRLARRAGHVARNPGDLPPAAAGRGRVRLRAGGRRQLRGRGAGRGLQREPSGGRDQRRLRVPVAVHDARRCARSSSRQVQVAESARDGDLGTLLARMVRRWRPELDVYLTTDRDVARLAGSDEAAPIRRIFYGVEEPMEIHLAILDGREGPLRDAVLRQSEEVRPAPDRHVSRAADRPREVDLQVQLDPRHGRVLRRQPVPRRVIGDDRRPRQPPRADRQHQGRAGQGGARPRRRPQLLRHQRHVHVEQDRPPGAPQAGRHRPDRPRLPQVPPLRARAGGRPAALHRRVPAHAVLDVREPGHQADQEGAAPAQGRGQARPREAAGADELHVRRPRREREAHHAGVSRHQAGPHLPLGRGVVRLRAVLAVPAAPHGDGRGGGDPRPDARIRSTGSATRRSRPGPASSTRRIRSSWTWSSCRTRTRCACGSTRPTRCTSRCRRSARARSSWSPTRTSTRWSPPSRRRSSPTPRRRRTSRSSPRSTWRGGRWSWRATSSSAGRSSWRSRSGGRSTGIRSSPSISGSRRRPR